MKYLILLFVLLVGTANATVFDCDNCTDCSAKIQNASLGDTVRLTADIENCSGNCVEFNGSDGITFDGGGYAMSGDAAYIGCGVHLSKHSDNNTVQNCNITKFRSGVYVFYAKNNTIHNVTSNSNYATGVTILYGRSIVLTDCVLQENPYYDIHFVPYVLEDCDMWLNNVTGSGGADIGFYNETVHLHDREFSALYLCLADGSTLENITIVPADGCKNNGVRIYDTAGANLTNIISSDNFEGISIKDSTNVHISDSEFNNSHHYNLFVSYGENNSVANTTTCGSSQAGIYLYHTSGTNLENMTVLRNAQGILFDNSNCTTMYGSVIKYNNLRGLGGFYSYGNLLYDNYFDNEKDVTGLVCGDWNVTPTAGTNIINGSSIGGNYWSNYNGTDADDDGFGDTPWAVGGWFDYLPLFKEVVYICGDVDANGHVSANDVVEAYRRAVDPEYNLPIECVADVDNNDYVSANDVVEIYRCAVDPTYILTCSC